MELLSTEAMHIYAIDIVLQLTALANILSSESG